MLHLKEKTSLLLVNEEACLHIVASVTDALYLWLSLVYTNKEGTKSSTTSPMFVHTHTHVRVYSLATMLYSNI